MTRVLARAFATGTLVTLTASSLVACGGGGPQRLDLSADAAGSTQAGPPYGASSPAPTGTSRSDEAQLIAERDERFLSCLVDNGIGVTPVEAGDGGWEIDRGGLDDAAYLAIENGCYEQVGPPVDVAAVTTAEASRMYDLQLAAKTCLEALGATVSEPPSREEWVDVFLASFESPVAPWTPYGPGAVSAYGEECPEPTLADLG